MNPIEFYLDKIDESRKTGTILFHNKYLDLINKSKGSKAKHQAWEGGYRNHLEQCFYLASMLYNITDYKFPFSSVVLVLYFHDIEKIWKYTTGDVYRPWDWFVSILPNECNIKFTSEELNALKYIHGEGLEYTSYRVMNELAGFCHACDILSARTFHDKKEINGPLAQSG